MTSMITHLVVVPSDTKERRTTFFQGFSDFWHPDYLTILKCLTHFPHDIADAYLSGERYVLSKSLGSGLQIQFLRADLLGGYLPLATKENLVVWSTGLTVDAVSNVISKVENKPHHISTARKEGTLYAGDLDKPTVRQVMSQMLSKLGGCRS